MFYICIYSPKPAYTEIHSSSSALNVFTCLHKIIKKLISVFGEKPARGLPKPPPTQLRRESAEFTRGENTIPGSGRGIGTRRKGKGGENNAKLNNSIKE
jgi:hypothetical protein